MSFYDFVVEFLDRAGIFSFRADVRCCSGFWVYKGLKFRVYSLQPRSKKGFCRALRRL